MTKKAQSPPAGKASETRSIVTRDRAGFTLIEALLMLLILGLLSAVVLGLYFDLHQAATDASARGILGAMRDANQLLHTESVIRNQAPTYTLADVVARVEMRGCDSLRYGAGGHSLELLVGGKSYTFYLHPPPGTLTVPSITELGHGNW